jgi:hypothetical protein
MTARPATSGAIVTSWRSGWRTAWALKCRKSVFPTSIASPTCEASDFLRRATAKRPAPLSEDKDSDNDNYRKETREQLPVLSEPRHPPLAAPLADELYQISEGMTRWGFTRRHGSDSKWRTKEVRHVGSDTIAAGF